MSGHSKWAKIKRAKGAVDAKRGQMHSKLTREINIAAHIGGGDIEANPRLRAAVLKARGFNMSRDTIDNAIKKGVGELKDGNYEELIYEAYAPGGIAVFIEVLTDNKNRTVSNIRNILTKAGGQLAVSGSVAWLFKRQGFIVLDGKEYTEDMITELAIEGGAEDVSLTEELIEITTAPDDFETVLQVIKDREFRTLSAEIEMVPETEISLDQDATIRVIKLLDRLEENDDVQNVYSNLAYNLNPDRNYE
ncbi:YebC/PmpR family DNA-binding transcriptional regulator [Treponema sp. TIM-1]|uniref:YebC/PmpR family DNA-binding transcriptional regulator n=1 Tax=Treponema sp. TIM-1 TaxID=2898417 RepID=UPI0039807DBB